MKTLSIAVRLLAITTLSVGAMSGAFASSDIVTGIGAVSGTDIVFSGGTLQTTGTGFQINASGPAGSTNPPPYFFNLGPTSEIGAPITLSPGSFDTAFGPGSFSIVEGSGVSAVTLLQGTFSTASLINTSGSAAQFSNNGTDTVTYTDPTGPWGTKFLSDNPGTSPPIFGDMGMTFLSVNSPGGGSKNSIHTIGTGSSQTLAGFTVGGFGGSFDADASVVPEASGSLLMLAALAPLGIVALLLRRKQTAALKLI